MPQTALFGDVLIAAVNAGQYRLPTMFPDHRRGNNPWAECFGNLQYLFQPGPEGFRDLAGRNVFTDVARHRTG